MLVGIVALRFLANLWIRPGPDDHLTLLASDLMLGLVFGLIAVTRLEIAIRARRLAREGALSRVGSLPRPRP